MDGIIKSVPLHLQAYDLIKDQIMKGYFKPGNRIVESKLAEILNISRGPIREALRMLIQDGLLVQQKGAIKVFNPTSKEMIDVYQCRESLEVLALQISIKNITKKEEGKLISIIEESKKLLKQNQYDDLARLDEEFHEIIVKSSGNKQLIKLMEVIKAKISYMLGFIIHKNFYLPPIEHHEKILNALLEKNEAEAIIQMKIHLKYGLDCLLENQDNNTD